MNADDEVARHYRRDGLAGALLAAARATLVPGEALAARHLAPVDEFHIGGLEATRRLVSLLDLRPGMAVLDVGSGIGGAARFIAESCDATVTGIDLTADYVAAAAALSEAVGLAGGTTFRCASALAMPFDDASFDAAVTLHVAMNIADKAALYREVARVLKPGAVFGIYDVLAGPEAASLAFPVPWAAGPETSFLATPDEMRALLGAAGFAVEQETERLAEARAFFERQRARLADGPPALGLHLLMGEGFRPRMSNMIANISAQCCAPWEFVCRRR